MQQQQIQQQREEEEYLYGPECEPSKAPEAITRSVASLPPEQMLELMRQMKDCVQVTMRAIGPQEAIAMLHREAPNIRNTPFHLQTQAPGPNNIPAPIGAAHLAPPTSYPPQGKE
uniref:CSTF2_hinge domain-containing protein n=1 Tax=Steinernema glaseri TaxID=37863 RepID=A0A1I7YQB0_9BILA